MGKAPPAELVLRVCQECEKVVEAGAEPTLWADFVEMYYTAPAAAEDIPNK